MNKTPPPSTAPSVDEVTLKRFGFPKQDGRALSYWLQQVQGDALLNHRTTPELPPSADIVVIGSGASVSS
jgi:hypothetical protein